MATNESNKKLDDGFEETPLPKLDEGFEETPLKKKSSTESTTTSPSSATPVEQDSKPLEASGEVTEITTAELPKTYDRLNPKSYSNLTDGSNYFTGAIRNGKRVVKKWDAASQAFRQAEESNLDVEKGKARTELLQTSDKGDAIELPTTSDIAEKAGVSTYLNKDKIADNAALVFNRTKAITQQPQVSSFLQMMDLYKRTDDPTVKEEISTKLESLKAEPFSFQETNTPIEGAQNPTLQPLMPSIPKLKTVGEAVKFAMEQMEEGEALITDYKSAEADLLKINEEYQQLNPQDPKAFWYNAIRAVEEHGESLRRANAITLGSKQESMEATENNYIKGKIFPRQPTEGLGTAGKLSGLVAATVVPTVATSFAATGLTGNPIAGMIAGGVYTAQDMARIQRANGLQEMYNEVRDKNPDMPKELAYETANEYSIKTAGVQSAVGLAVGMFLPTLRMQSVALNKTTTQLAKSFFVDLAKDAGIDFTFSSGGQGLTNYIGQNLGSDRSIFDGVLETGGTEALMSIGVGLLTGGFPTAINIVKAKSFTRNREKMVNFLASSSPQNVEQVFGNAIKNGSSPLDVQNLRQEVIERIEAFSQMPPHLSPEDKLRLAPLYEARQRLVTHLKDNPASESGVLPEIEKLDRKIAEEAPYPLTGKEQTEYSKLKDIYKDDEDSFNPYELIRWRHLKKRVEAIKEQKGKIKEENKISDIEVRRKEALLKSEEYADADPTGQMSINDAEKEINAKYDAELEALKTPADGKDTKGSDTPVEDAAAPKEGEGVLPSDKAEKVEQVGVVEENEAHNKLMRDAKIYNGMGKSERGSESGNYARQSILKQAKEQGYDYFIDSGGKITLEKTPEAALPKVEVAETGEVGNPAYKKTDHKQGRTITKTIADGTKLTGTYKIVSADDVVASHNEETFSQSEGYPKNEQGTTINDRDYSKDTNAQTEVHRIAQNLDDRAISQTPVVTKDGIVIDGNNRTMSRKLAAKNKTDKAYTEALKEQAELYGLKPEDVDGVKNPMLVFEPKEDLPYDTKTLSRFNKAEKKEKSPVERAVEVSKTITDFARRQLGEIYSKAEKPSDVTSDPKSIKEVVKLLQAENIIQPNELPRYFDVDRMVATKEGVSFMESLMMGSALDEKAIRLLDNENMGNVRQKILKAIVPLTQNAALGENALTRDIEGAIDLVNKAKQEKSSVLDAVRQLGIFEQGKYSPEELWLAHLLDGEGFGDFLKRYNGDVGKDVLFEGKLTKDRIIDNALRQTIDNYEKVRPNLRSSDTRGQKEVQGDNGGGKQEAVREEPAADPAKKVTPENKTPVEPKEEGEWTPPKAKNKEVKNPLIGKEVEFEYEGQKVTGKIDRVKPDGSYSVSDAEGFSYPVKAEDAKIIEKPTSELTSKELYERGLNKIKEGLTPKGVLVLDTKVLGGLLDISRGLIKDTKANINNIIEVLKEHIKALGYKISDADIDTVAKEIKDSLKAEKRFEAWKDYGKSQFRQADGNLDLATFKEKFKKRFDTGEIEDAEIVQVFSEAQSEYNAERKVKTTAKEVDKSLNPDDKVTLSEKSLLKKQIRDKISGAFSARTEQKNLSDMVLTAIKAADIKGTLTAGQVKAIVRAAQKVAASSKDSIGRRKLNTFFDYLDKVIDDAKYEDNVSTAKGLQTSIIKLSNRKETSAANKAVGKIFAKINPSKVENVEEYNQIAAQVKNNLKGVTAKVEDGRGVTKNDTPKLTNEQILDYADKELYRQSEMTKQSLAEEYPELMDVMRKEIAEEVYGKKLADVTPEELKKIDESIPIQEIEQLIEHSKEGDEAFDAALSKLDKIEQKERVLRNLAKYKILDLANHVEESTNAMTGGDANRYTPRQKKVLDAVQKIDVSNLGAKDLILLNNTINNIVENGDFSNAGKVQVISEGQQSFTALKPILKKLGFKPDTITSAIVKSMANNSLLFEFITRSSKAAAEIQRFFSIRDVQDGHAKAQQAQTKLYDDYMKLTGGLSKEINTNDNLVRRGVTSYVEQNIGGTDVDIAKEFQRRKNIVKETYEKLLSEEATTDERKEGELVKKTYDELLDGSNTVAEVYKKLDATNKDNKKVIDFFKKRHDEMVDAVEESAVIDNNEDFTRWNNYTSTKTKGFGGKSVTGEKDIKELVGQYFGKKITSDEAGSKMARTKMEKLPSNMVVDFDFDKVQLDRMYEAKYDLETSHPINKLSWMMKQKDALEVLGGADNRKTVATAMVETLGAQRGSSVPVNPMIQNLTKGLNVLQLKGARMALGGVSQVVKQPLVITTTLTNLGKDMPLFFSAAKEFFTNKDVDGLLNMGEIGNRGVTMGGYNKDAVIKTLDKLQFGTAHDVINKVNNSSHKLSELIFTPLVKSDVVAAKISWLSYYMKDMKSRGKEIDFKVRDEEAAAYAEQMVQRFQGANDPSSMASFYKTQDAGMHFVKNTMLPFSTFSTTQKMSIAADMKKLVAGNKMEGAKGITSRAVESVVYNAVKGMLVAPVMYALYQGVANQLGLYSHESDKEKAEREAKEKEQHGLKANAEKAAVNATRDFFFQGIGSLAQSGAEFIVNKGLKLATGTDEDFFYQYQPKDNRHAIIGTLGVYGNTINRSLDLVTRASMLTGDIDAVTKGGFEPEFRDAELTDEQYRAFLITYAVDALAISGVSDADLLNINERLKNQLDKNILETFGGKKKIEIYKKEAGGSGGRRKNPDAIDDKLNDKIDNKLTEPKGIGD